MCPSLSVDPPVAIILGCRVVSFWFLFCVCCCPCKSTHGSYFHGQIDRLEANARIEGALRKLKAPCCTRSSNDRTRVEEEVADGMLRPSLLPPTLTLTLTHEGEQERGRSIQSSVLCGVVTAFLFFYVDVRLPLTTALHPPGRRLDGAFLVRVDTKGNHTLSVMKGGEVL